MPSIVHGYYGKLPISPEFLRLHAAGPELRWLDDWLQRGVLYAKSREGPQWSTLVAQSDVWNFLYAPAQPGRIVCGALCMSHDKAGRSFPFLAFQLLEGENLFRCPWVVPLMSAAALDELKAILESLRTSLDWSEFCRRLDAISNSDVNVHAALEDFDHYLQTATVNECWTGVVDNSSNHTIGHIGQGFRDAVHSVRQSENGRMSSGMKIPLALCAMREPYDVSFWIAAMIRVMSRQQPPPGLVVLWNRNPKEVTPCAIGSWGPGSPNVLRFLVSPCAEDDSWRDVRAEKLSEERFAAALDALDKPEASLQQFLDYLTITA